LFQLQTKTLMYFVHSTRKYRTFRAYVQLAPVLRMRSRPRDRKQW